MKAIILSAGQGRRLMPLTQNTPKCCLMLDGKSLLEHQIDALAANGIAEVVVVTGFGHQMVEQVVSNIRDIPVRTLYNPFYALSDNLGTCWVARGEMQEPFLLINGDTLFEPNVLASLLSNPQPHPITLATDHKGVYDEDDMKISAVDGLLNRVGKKLGRDIVNGESIGMMIFNRAGADIFVQKIEQLMGHSTGLARWYLSAIDDLARSGLVGVSSINGLSWCEVDDLTDFAHARETVMNWHSQRNDFRVQCEETSPPARSDAGR